MLGTLQHAEYVIQGFWFTVNGAEAVVYCVSSVFTMEVHSLWGWFIVTVGCFMITMLSEMMKQGLLLSGATHLCL